MDSYIKALIIIPVVIIIALGGLYFYLNSSSSPSLSRSRFSDRAVERPTTTGDVENTAKVTVGTDQISTDSEFTFVTDGTINYVEGGVEKTAMLSTEDVVIACTRQDIIGLSELDFDQVDSIRVVAPTELNDIITEGTTVVVFANADAQGNFIAHTLAVSDLDLCL